MSQPKKKTSRSRRDIRRFALNNKIKKPTAVTCPNCNEPTRPHTVCACGYYKGKEILSVRQKTTET